MTNHLKNPFHEFEADRPVRKQNNESSSVIGLPAIGGENFNLMGSFDMLDSLQRSKS